MLSKIIYIFISLAVIALVSFISMQAREINILNKENASLKSQLASLESSLNTQNNIIQKNALELESYKANAPKQKEKIIQKYQTITKTDTDCKAQLENINTLLQTFYNR